MQLDLITTTKQQWKITYCQHNIQNVYVEVNIAKCAWEKNDQPNMKNVSEKTMSNNCAECAWGTDTSTYTECACEND